VELRGSCEAIARKLGNALCAPIIGFVPEGNIDPPSGHMLYPGTISVRQETYRMLVDDVASSLKVHGFTDIVLIGDSGGNQPGLEEVAKTLNERWAGTAAKAHYVGAYYDAKDSDVHRYMEEVLGFVETVQDGIHDNARVTALVMAEDPRAARFDERVAAGRTTINGVSIVPLTRMVELGHRLVDFHAEHTVKAIREAIAQSRR
jgi:creatinine amidohydrolase/Fe(II)-dependent formamide hydrolase-like protein